MRYLVVEPHPDDMAFFFGGTVAKLVAEGHEVHVLVVTDGEQGTLDPKYDTDDKLAAVQLAEEQAACEILGIREISYLNEKCHFVEPTHSFREKIVRHLRRVQPTVVMTLDPWNKDENPDHRAVGLATLEACSFAHFHLFHPEHLDEGLMTAVVSKMVFGKTKNPNTFVDVSEFLEKKIEAILCYESQLEMMWQEGQLRLEALGKTSNLLQNSYKQVLPQFIHETAQTVGKQAGLKAAEGFRIQALGVVNHLEDLTGEV